MYTKFVNLYLHTKENSSLVMNLSFEWMNLYLVTANHHGVALSNKFSILDYQQEDRYKITIT